MSNPATPAADYKRASLLCACLALGVICLASLALQPPPALARSVDRSAAEGGPEAGEEPPAGPIVYNLQPESGAAIFAEDLGHMRVGATIETQHEGGVSSAGISIDGRELPNPSLGGAYTYLQSVSYGMGSLSPGEHTVEVTAVDSMGRTGGHEWTFTVAPVEGETTSNTPPTETPPTAESVPQSGTGQEGAAVEDVGSGDTQPASTTEIEQLPDTGGISFSAVMIAGAALLVAGCSMWLCRTR